MPKLKYSVSSLDDVDAALHDFYVEKDGKFVLDVEGVRTDGDIARLQSALNKEREEHRKTKGVLEAFGDLDPEDVRAKLDKYDELEAAAGGQIDEGKINQIVEARIKGRLTPLERQLQKERDEKAKFEASVKEFEARERTRSIQDAVRAAAVKAKLRDTAIDDALVLAERVFDVQEDGSVKIRDQVGFPPGLSPDEWFGEVQKSRPHWWPESNGGGARGGGNTGGLTSNPWSHEGWNMTKQGEFIKQHGTERAEAMAKAAGTSLGGGKPPAKK